MRAKVAYIAIIALFVVACSGTSSQSLSTLSRYVPRHAKGFTIEYDSVAKCDLLRIRDPYQGNHSYEQIVRLDRKAQRIAVLSSSFVAMLDLIGESSRIVGISGTEYIINPALRRRIDEGKVAEIGHESALRYEVLKSLDVDVVLLYGLYGEDTSLTAKLQQIGIPYIYIGDYTETSPLGKAEWCVALAAICQCRERGEEEFRKIEQRYIALRDSIAEQRADHKRCRVMLNTPYRDKWFMPPAQSYFVRLIEDGGGEYIYPQNRSHESVPIAIEEALLLLCQADVWMNVGLCNSIEELQRELPRFANVKAIKDGRIYNNNRRQGAMGGSDFWESGSVRPDIILRDVAEILCGKGDDEKLYYYKQLR